MSEDRSSNEQKSWFNKLTQAFAHEPRNRQELLEVLRDAHQNKLLDSEALTIVEGAIQVADLQVRDIMVPKLRAGDSSGAIEAGASAVLGILGGDAAIQEKLDSSPSGSGQNEELTRTDILICLVFFGLMGLKSMFGGGMRTSRRYGGGFYSSGRSSGSSFGGGGGSFGGGGSSGSW